MAEITSPLNINIWMYILIVHMFHDSLKHKILKYIRENDIDGNIVIYG